MGVIVHEVEQPWQAGLAIDQWIQSKEPANSLMILEDLGICSYWLSKTNLPLKGDVSIRLDQTVQAELLEKITTYLSIEGRHPGSRDDLLFEILHHPVFGLDQLSLAKATVQFYRARSKRSFREFVLTSEAALDCSGEPMRKIVEALESLKTSSNLPSHSFIARHLIPLAGNQRSKLILETLASAPNWEALMELCLNDRQGFSVSSSTPISTLPSHILLCRFNEPSSKLVDSQEFTLITSPRHSSQFTSSPIIPKPRIPLLPEASLQDILSKYTLSVSHLNKLLQCPLSFYFETILRSPVGKRASMAFGSAVHYAMEKAFRRMLRDADKHFPGVSEIEAFFQHSMEWHRAFFGEQEFSTKLAYGKRILQRHFEAFEDQWSRIATIERRIKTTIDGVPVQGFIDKIEFDYYRATIVDYKTGDPSKYPHRFLPPGHKEAPNDFIKEYGGNYWRQAVFYYLLVKHDTSNKWQPSKVVFEYLEPQDRTEKLVEIQPSREEQEAVRDQIQLANEKIGERAFDQGCGEADCKWCRLVAEHIQPK